MRRLAILILIVTIILPPQPLYANLLLSILNPNVSNLSFAYDSIGNLLSYEQKDIGALTRFEYNNPFNQVSLIRDPKNQLTYFYYDSQGNLTQIKDALNNITKLG